MTVSERGTVPGALPPSFLLVPIDCNRRTARLAAAYVFITVISAGHSIAPIDYRVARPSGHVAFVDIDLGAAVPTNSARFATKTMSAEVGVLSD